MKIISNNGDNCSTMEIKIRTVSIEDYDEIYKLWNSTEQ